jgi:hypothetical protein
MEPLPIACSLGASDLQARLRELGAFGRANLIERAAGDDGPHLRFRRTPEAEARLRSIIEAERRCCPFLDFDLVEDDDALELRITAPDDGLPVAEQLAAAFG